MNKIKLLLLSIILTLGSFSSANAHVLVFKCRAISLKEVDSKGNVETKSIPSTYRILLVLDLDTDFVRENAAQQTDTETIWLDEKTKSFTHEPDGDDGNTLGHSSCTKFEFFNNSKSFYLFQQDSQNFGAWGTDYGTMFATGACNLNVGIGGSRTSSVPQNFTATQHRGDSHEFKTNTFGAEFDATMTKAVNNYLVSKKIKSTKGSESSLAVKSAKNWLISTYLPGKSAYPNKFPSN